MTINLDNLSLKELKALQIGVAKAIADFGDRQRRAALAEIEEIAQAKGFSLAELTGGAGDHHLHGCSNKSLAERSARRGATASFSDSAGCAD